LIRFALIGVAGFVARKHLHAIKAAGHQLIASMDQSDSVGILDSYFPESAFFTEFDQFDSFLKHLNQEGYPINYLSVCTPNHLHSAHVQYGLKLGAQVICEKPLVLDPLDIDHLCQLEQETGREIFTILQLRLHPAIVALKEQALTFSNSNKAEVDLTYITPRGQWYYASWKGDPVKSGGIATNIGIHFFDLLIWIFGKVEQLSVHIYTDNRAAGYLELERARVRWYLSIERSDLSDDQNTEQQIQRTLIVNGDAIQFGNSHQELHTKSYENIIFGKGFHIEDVRPSIEVVHKIRSIRPVGLTKHSHPLAVKQFK
jgi:UDP-N-acetyl-2-amino-2-deoxyglucuronate dehydrogenase